MNKDATRLLAQGHQLNQVIKVLLVEDRLADARLVEHALAAYLDAKFETHTCKTLLTSLEYLNRNSPNVIIADLNLPDSVGSDTFEQIHKAAPITPLVIMTAHTDSRLGVSAVDAGAQDYLIKGEIESQSLGRLLLQAIARQNLRQSMAQHLQDVESSRTRLHNLVDLNIDGILIVNRDGKVIFANRRSEELFGLSHHQLMHHTLGRPVSDEIGSEIAITDKYGKVRKVHMRSQATGWDNDDAYMVLLSEISDSSRGLLRHSANAVDNVTGLFSRDMFYEQARLCLQHAQGNNLTPALLCVNLDSFRRINEAMGHVSGDELLRLVGERIRRQLRAGDIIGRFGSDEFLILLAPLRRALDADNVSKKIMESLAEPIALAQNDLRITARTGVSIYPQDGVRVDELVSHAQVASQRAKQAAGGHVHYYTHDLTQRSERRFQLEQQLRRALPQQQFDLAYQPIVDVQSGQIQGVEALLRWRTDSAEQIGPAEFVPILEETGLINGVGEWAMRRACEQTQQWWQAGVELQLSVNLSPVQFESPRLLAIIESALNDSGLPAKALCLELTESVLMRNIEASVSTLKALRNKGVAVAIDDFGTGFSSLNYLKRFAIDTLKIDRSFIRDVMLGGHDAAITHATIDLAHNLGLKVVAEGVEEPGQLGFLKTHGCDTYQGYFFSRPTTPEGILELYKSF